MTVQIETLDKDETAQAAAAISQGVARLLVKLVGRGPERARTLIDDDVVVCRLFDPYTRAERKLLERGHAESVRQSRRALHEATSDAFAAIVERATGRGVRGLIADVHADADIAVLVFFLDPSQPHRRG